MTRFPGFMSGAIYAVLLALVPLWSCASNNGASQDAEIFSDAEFDSEAPEAIAIEWKKGCNPFATSGECILPYPSLFYEKADPESPTGVRVNYPLDAIPVSGEFPPFNMDPTNLADGVSPAGPVLLHFSADVHADFLTTRHELHESVEPGNPIALFNLESGKRIVFMSEMDMNRKDDFPDRYALIVRPLEPMEMGTRHVIALKKELTDSGGNPLQSPAAFVALRDGIPTTNEEIEKIRPRFEELFDFLEAHGYARGELLLAWDFSVASKEFLLGSVLSMREKTLEEVTGKGLGYTITKIEDNPNQYLARIVEGDFEVPTFITLENSIVYDENHHPIRQYPNRKFPFTMIIPKKALTRTDPLPLVMFGHGIFGSGRGYLSGSGGIQDKIHDIAEQKGVVMLATDWIGLSKGDLDLIINDVLYDLNRISIVTDRLQQSLINNLTLTELALGALTSDPKIVVGEGNLLDPEQVIYFGVSLGGIQGTSFVAISNRIKRGVLAVPGSVWLNMIPRSTVWIPIKAVADQLYPDPLVQQMAIAFAQTWFDHSDPINLSWLLFDEPPGDAQPDRRVIFQESIGDSQVPNICTEMLARARKVKLMTPSIYDVYGLEKVESPASESTLVQYRLPNWDKPAPPEANLMPEGDNGVHSDMVFLPNALMQAAHFLETGEVVRFCDGACDPD